MGFKNVGISLVEQCTKYAKAYGKSNILQTKPIRAINTKGLNLAPSLKQDIVQLSTVSKGTEVISKNNKNLQQLLQRLNSSDEKFGRYTLENLGVDDLGVYLTEKGYRGPKIYIEGGDMSNLDFRKGFLKAFQLGGHQTARVSSNGAITILEPYKGNINQREIRNLNNGHKILERNNKGKFKQRIRQTNVSVGDPVLGRTWSQKTVEHLDNGLTRVTYGGDNGLKLLRNNKGEIVEIIKPSSPPNQPIKAVLRRY